MEKYKKIITCAGYGATGSSVVTDLLKEFDNMKSMGSFEFSFPHEVDGLSDLQHYVVDDFHRLKIDEGIHRFKRMVKNMGGWYQPYFNGKFFTLTEAYIQELIDVSWEGYWHQHAYRLSRLGRKLSYEYPSRFRASLHRFFGKKDDYEYIPYYKRSEMYFSFARERFFTCTRNYTEALFRELDLENRFEHLVLDQLVPPSNTERYLQYFNDVKIIVVDRDPRDLYLLNKLFWKEGWIPSEEIGLYIKWFRLMREHLKYEKDDPQKVLRINFEEFVYNYDAAVDRVKEFLNLSSDSHVNKFKHFNPDISIKNTRLWEKYQEHREDISLIEKELPEFCYRFEKRD
ncbi:MAG: sulfotransferase family protein [Bacillota bacterium]|nr:sulfotransferase family protein [Bacillota bacterium]